MCREANGQVINWDASGVKQSYHRLLSPPRLEQKKKETHPQLSTQSDCGVAVRQIERTFLSFSMAVKHDKNILRKNNDITAGRPLTGVRVGQPTQTYKCVLWRIRSKSPEQDDMTNRYLIRFIHCDIFLKYIVYLEIRTIASGIRIVIRYIT